MKRGSSSVRAAALATVAVTVPARADAHLVTTGLGPVYDGISHVLMSADDLLLILAMALLSGLNGKTAARRALFGFTAAWLTGGLVGMFAAGLRMPPVTLAAPFLVLGALTAADRTIRPIVVAWLAMAIGILGGLLNGIGIAEAGQDGMALVGIAIVIFVVVTLVTAVVTSLRAAWTRVAVRMLGSWVAAIGLLVLGWSLRAGT